ncbi:unnamed protein product [Camellia sinensis]
MGNCTLKGVAAAAAAPPNSSIRIMTDSGEIIEFKAPKIVGEVLNDFPGYGIFGSSHVSSPLLNHEKLHFEKFYYLFPLGEKDTLAQHNESVKEAEPVRMSTSAAAVEVLPPPQKGVWRVKLVIDTKQLEEILSEEVNTEALIEQMRLAASSASVTPKRTKINWGQWGVNLKPILTNVFKGSIDQQSRVARLPDFSISGPIQGKATNERILGT